MAEATDSADALQADGQPSTGALLRQAREAKGLSILQVAQTLHLDAWILEALEANRFKDIGAPVFVKGHLRKFAAEVGLENDSIMSAYYRSEDMPETPRLVTDTLTRPAGGSRGRGPIIVFSIVLIGLIALVAWLWLRGHGFTISGADAGGAMDQTASTVSTGPVISPQENSVSMPEMTPATLPVPADTETADEVTGTSAEAAARVATTRLPDPPVEVRESTVAEGEFRLSIEFANDSWAEIYDAGNRRLFFDLGEAGTRRVVSGVPPFQVLLGNAEGARVILNGDTFAIPPGARRGKTARFSVQ